MTSVSNTGNSVLDALNGVSSTSSKASTSSSTSTDTASATGTSALGKDAFLQLLVTQMKNQDPLSPQDNTQFVSQLAQFSSLESMNNLSSTVGTISTTFQSSQALQASALVGRSVTVEASTAQLTAGSSISGSVAIPTASASNTVGVYDANGNLVKSIDLGTQAAGTASFTWDGTDSSGAQVAAGNYSFKAISTVDGADTALTTYLPAVVNSVTMASTAGGEMTLNLAGGSSVALSSVKSVGT